MTEPVNLKSKRPERESSSRIVPAAAEPRGFLRGAISAFILFHLIAIACWAIPVNFFPIKDVKNFVRPYMIWSGLFQSWDFFAPNPKKTNSYVAAVVLTQDRRQKLWVFPRMDRISYAQRYREERYRKFEEVLPHPKNAALWPGVAKHISDMFNNPADPPAAVLLFQFSAPIRLCAPGGDNPTPKPHLFYEYVESVPAQDTQ